MSVASYPTLPVAAVSSPTLISIIRETLEFWIRYSHRCHADKLGHPEGLQDVGEIGSEADVAYTSLRSPKEDDPQYLEIERRGYVGRDLVCTVHPPEPLLNFLAQKPGQSAKSKKLVPGSCGTMEDLPYPFEVSAYKVDNPIYGSWDILI
ncbi:MAG: hypothetical protein LUO93_02335 [Methanomicrobiales archaeon]|nr:hypothetical protein [Methanomicrobiales archaeon]